MVCFLAIVEKSGTYFAGSTGDRFPIRATFLKLNPVIKSQK